MTVSQSGTVPLSSPEVRARWRTAVGLDCPPASPEHVARSQELVHTPPWSAISAAQRTSVADSIGMPPLG